MDQPRIPAVRVEHLFIYFKVAIRKYNSILSSASMTIWDTNIQWQSVIVSDHFLEVGLQAFSFFLGSILADIDSWMNFLIFVFHVSRQFPLCRAVGREAAHVESQGLTFSHPWFLKRLRRLPHYAAVLFENAAVQVLERKEIVLVIRQGRAKTCFRNLGGGKRKMKM